MGIRRIHLFASIRRRLGFDLARPWRRRELVRVSVDELSDGPRVVSFDRPLDPRDTDDVVSLLGWGDRTQRRDGADHRPGPLDGEGTGTRPEQGLVESSSGTGTWFVDDSRHSHTSGWTVIDVDCE